MIRIIYNQQLPKIKMLINLKRTKIKLRSNQNRKSNGKENTSIQAKVKKFPRPQHQIYNRSLALIKILRRKIKWIIIKIKVIKIIK